MSTFANKNSRAAAKVYSTRGSDETLDTLFEGDLKLYQSCSGYRFSLDALLLAHFLTCRNGEKIADLGAGNGVIALILAYLHPSLSITGVEIQPSMVDRGRRNVQLNGFQGRVTIRQADVRNIQGTFSPESFAAVVCNPPYRRMTSGRISPDAERKIARHETVAELADFLRAGAYLLPIKGRMAWVYPALRVVELLQSMRKGNLEPKRLRMVHSFGEANASLVLVEGVKGGRSGIEVLSPLVVYKQGKQYTSEVEAMLAGKAATLANPGSRSTNSNNRQFFRLRRK
jgi:tRNA1(Val) A37 N6-methylase TrmN6